MTERVVCPESSRENDNWWKSFMRTTDENHSRAVVPKIPIVKHYRMPALKDRICWNLK